jgi:thiaminase/transcriptional activator TenA
MQFTDKLWSEIKTIHQSILCHPLIEELTEGTLPKEKFLFYLKQDNLFLLDYVRAVSLITARAPRLEFMDFLAEVASTTTKFERDMQQGIFVEEKIKVDVPKTPACFAFTHYLISTGATATFGECIAMLLASAWSYREVGKYMHARSKPNNPYQRWIDTYVSKEFDCFTNQYIEMTNTFAEQASPEERERMLEAFTTTARLEWMFWDSCYHTEAWSI